MNKLFNSKILDLKSLNQKYVKVHGTLVPISWDHNDEPVVFSIYTYDEEDYVVQRYKSKDTLRKYLGQKVEAQGNIYECEHGEKYIDIKNLKVTNSFPPTHSSLKLEIEHMPVHLNQKALSDNSFLNEIQIAS